MCDRAHFDELENTVEELRDGVSGVKADMREYHARTDARLEGMEEAVKSLTQSTAALVKMLVASLIAIVTVAVLALVYGSVGQQGFNAVTGAAKEVSR